MGVSRTKDGFTGRYIRVTAIYRTLHTVKIGNVYEVIRSVRFTIKPDTIMGMYVKNDYGGQTFLFYYQYEFVKKP